MARPAVEQPAADPPGAAFERAPDPPDPEELAVPDDAEAPGADPRGFRCEVVPEPDGVVVCIAGDLDMATAPELGETLESVGRRGCRRVVVDLAACGFLDSSGLAVILEARNRAREEDGDVALRGPNERILRLLDITNVRDDFSIEP